MVQVVTRRRQEERTAETRGALLRATIEVLAERGYAATTTTAIAKAAGVSRGAQLHHFPSKLELIASALGHVFVEHELTFRTRFGELSEADRNQVGAAAVFAQISDSPHQLALLELLNAARTDDELRPLARRVLRHLEREITTTYAEVLPEAEAGADAATRVLVALALLQSASLHRELGLSEEAAQLETALRDLATQFPLPGANHPLPHRPRRKESPNDPR